MQDEILTVEEAANKLALRCARWSQSTIESLVKDVLAGDPPLGELGSLYAAAHIVLAEAPDLASRLTERLDQGHLKARNPMHGGRISLNGQPAHNGVFVSLAEAAQALREHDQIIFADLPIHDEEPACAIDPAPEQAATTSAVPEQNEQAAPENNEPPVPDNDKPPLAWQESARAIADRCFDTDTRNKSGDSLRGYSQRVMNEMSQRGIRSTRGLIKNWRTIQREALQGQKWWKTKAR